MTKTGVCIMLAEECIFAYSVYVVPFYIYCGWWNHLKDGDKIKNHYEELVKVAAFFILFFVCQFCFLRTSFTNPGWISAGEVKQENGSVLREYLERKHNGKARTCAKCKAQKPDRAHHCSICNRCVLKMDHHCPFVNNCIGFYNYKYFFNFLFWIMAFTIYVIVLVALYMVNIGNYDYRAIAAGFVCVVVLFLVSILFFSHARFIIYNRTTIEHMEKRKQIKRNPYDVGAWNNISQVLGTNILCWCVPCCWTGLGDGRFYEVRPDSSETSCLLSNSNPPPP